MSTSAVEITLLGRTYSIACPKGREDTLRTVANEVESQLTNLKTRTNNLSREELAIMAALNIGNLLIEEKQKNQQYMSQMDERISLLQATLENSLIERSTKDD
ncbi:cell division protein ZapA [Shewanella gaetbuli]|uniref:Cell division protein ZapA n=1 Tax=Shewanella gaetbuli TaxID=220752 RepID=A0A9X1ZHE7_9GAMM|nr:cell division protein ZapA [Shewanella gaetbuli]MCL1142359.1 cell division protein ZapA [Shewanella gaetbuli]